MSIPDKPEILVRISTLLDQLAEDLPVGTAWLFAACAKVPGDKLATMLCTNQETDEQALNILHAALEAKYEPDAVAETHMKATRQ